MSNVSTVLFTTFFIILTLVPLINISITNIIAFTNDTNPNIEIYNYVSEGYNIFFIIFSTVITICFFCNKNILYKKGFFYTTFVLYAIMILNAVFGCVYIFLLEKIEYNTLFYASIFSIFSKVFYLFYVKFFYKIVF